MQHKGPQTYSHEELTSIRKADAARGKDSPPRTPPTGQYYNEHGVVVGTPPETNIDYENVSRDNSFKQKAAAVKDAPPSIPDLHYLDKNTGDWVHVLPEVENFDPAIKAREQSFRRKAAAEKDNILPPAPIRPPAPQGWTDSSGKGWTQTRPDDMIETSEGHWVPHSDASFHNSSAISKDRSLRIEHKSRDDSFKPKANAVKENIQTPPAFRPPAPQGWSDSAGKGWTRTRPDHMIDASEGHWITRPDLDPSFRHSFAISKDRSLRIEQLTKNEQPYSEAHLKRAQKIIDKIEIIRNPPDTEGPQMQIQLSL